MVTCKENILEIEIEVEVEVEVGLWLGVVITESKTVYRNHLLPVKPVLF